MRNVQRAVEYGDRVSREYHPQPLVTPYRQHPVIPAPAGNCRLCISRSDVFGPTGQPYDSPRHRLGNLVM
jgi:hypothetical protein